MTPAVGAELTKQRMCSRIIAVWRLKQRIGQLPLHSGTLDLVFLPASTGGHEAQMEQVLLRVIIISGAARIQLGKACCLCDRTAPKRDREVRCRIGKRQAGSL